MRTPAVALAVLCCSPVLAQAAYISIGDYSWNVINQPTIPITINISGGESINSCGVGFSVGDGGAAMGGAETILVDSINYTAGTIWTGKPLATDENPPLPSASATGANVAIDGLDNVSANGTLMTVTLRAPAGGLAGRIGETLTLSPNAADTTALYLDGVPVDLTWDGDSFGTLTLTPEPSGLVMLAGVGMLGLLLYRRRK